MNKKIRDLLGEFGRLPCDVAKLGNEADLYAAGLSSFASVQLMLGIEEAFDIEFPERMLNRRSFSSISAIEQAVAELLAPKVPA